MGFGSDVLRLLDGPYRACAVMTIQDSPDCTKVNNRRILYSFNLILRSWVRHA